MRGWSEGRDLGVVGYRRILHVVADDVSQHRDLPRQHPQARGRSGCPSTCASSPASSGSRCELARACPDTQLVLDHCGDPGHRRRPRRGRAVARRASRRSPRCRTSPPSSPASIANVRAGHREPRDRAALRRAGDRDLRPRPLPLGQRLAGGEHAAAATCRTGSPPSAAILAGYSEAEQAAMAHGTAERVYSVRLPAGA